jgi:hypothetical protein
MNLNVFFALLIKALVACHRYPDAALRLVLILAVFAMIGVAWRW